jgi:hypothetical protein
VEHLGLFITWLRHAGAQTSGVDAVPGGVVLRGPGRKPVRGARRVNVVLCEQQRQGIISARARQLVDALPQQRHAPRPVRELRDLLALPTKTEG